MKTYQLGEEMFNGFPAFPSDPPRLHDMFLYVLGYQAPPGFAAGGGIQASPTPIGPNLVSAHEERFSENFTFQIATQIDGLNHLGLGEIFYNGFRGPEIATPTGTSALGNETMGPVATRGVIYDVVGLKMAQGRTDCYFFAGNGEPVLNDDYRITLDDMRGLPRTSTRVRDWGRRGPDHAYGLDPPRTHRSRAVSDTRTGGSISKRPGTSLTRRSRWSHLTAGGSKS